MHKISYKYKEWQSPFLGYPAPARHVWMDKTVEFTCSSKFDRYHQMLKDNPDTFSNISIN